MTDAEILRQKAEEQLTLQKDVARNIYVSEAGTLKIVHELQVHQIELEMQNEQLTEAKEKADAAAQKYSELYDFAPSGYITLSKEGRIIGLNLKGADLLGKERQRLINNRFDLYVSVGTRQIFNQFLSKVFKGKINEWCEVILSDESKNISTYVHLAGHVLENNEQIVLSAVDISGLKLGEQVLRESEEKFRVLIESTSVAIYLTDSNGKCTYVNPKWCEMAHLSYSEALNDGWVTGIYEEDRDKVFKNWQKMIASDGNWGFEYRFGPHDKVSWVFGTAKSYKNDSGRIMGFIGSNVDITERKKAEEKQKEIEDRYRLLAEQSDVGVGLYSPDGIILYFNNRALKNLGGKLEDFVGKSMIDVFGKKAGEKYNKRISEGIRLNKTLVYEDQLESPSGKYWFSTSNSIFRDINGEVAGIQAVSIDITQRKENEEQLVKSANELRYLSRHQVEVREAERSAIARDLHDDLGQKLTALIMDMSWVKSRIGVQSGTVRNKMQQMLIEMNEIIESIQKLSFRLSPTILNDLGLIAAIQWFVKEFNKTSQIRCDFAFSPKNISVNCKLSLEVYRIVQESLTNVARHSCASTASVTMNLKKGKLTITISDNGSGISKAKIESTRSFGLIGMRERVRIFNGELSVSGSKGKGTVVKVVIPVNE
jgi:PAS domain S-box-containing protein